MGSLALPMHPHSYRPGEKEGPEGKLKIGEGTQVRGQNQKERGQVTGIAWGKKTSSVCVCGGVISPTMQVLMVSLLESYISKTVMKTSCCFNCLLSCMQYRQSWHRT